MTLTELVILGAAAARLATLIGDDKITAPLRARLPGRWLQQLVSCTVWCLPIWTSAALWFAPRPVVNILAIAAVAAPINVVFGRWHLPGEHRAFPIRTAVVTAAHAASMAAEAAMIRATQNTGE